MNELNGADGRPASPEGRPEPLRPATFYDLRLFVMKVREEPPVWSAHFEELGAPGESVWRTDQSRCATVTGAIARAFADCVEAMAAREVVPRVE
jgi:hypothetical protein